MIDPVNELLRRLRETHGALPPHPNEVKDKDRTFGERVADGLARAAGSWTFIVCFVLCLATWIVLNSRAGAAAVDPAPFILLNLLLSCVAALQAPVILMSQNRQGDRDRLQADLDYAVNVKAELEVAELRRELAELRREQWAALLALQAEQTELLRDLSARSRPLE